MRISASLFAADASKLTKELTDIERNGIKYLHIDIMDGHFVPNFSFGSNVVACIRPKCKLIFDVHLMLEYPLRFCRSFIEAGADIITVHAEIKENIEDIYEICKQNNVGFGLAICPATPVISILKYVSVLDLILVMGVNPGFGGQRFIPETLKRIKEVLELRISEGAHYLVSVDGGVNENTVFSISSAGADMIVVGTAFFGNKNRKEAIEKIRCKMERGY